MYVKMIEEKEGAQKNCNMVGAKTQKTTTKGLHFEL